MAKKYWKFEQGECELIHARVTPIIQSIIVKQKCISCGKDTGFGYYSDTGKQKEKYMKSKCEDCINKTMVEACSKDESHTMRLSL